MSKIDNKSIRNLSIKSMKKSKVRNIIAVLAISLTTVLFTSLFTIALSINSSFQQANFRQAGGWAQASFKYITQKQADAIKEDHLIKQYGLRRLVGLANGTPFLKSHVEIGYSDNLQAHWMFCDPIEGSLPAEGSNEAATDTKVLELLGVEPVLGNKFTITFDAGGTDVTETFILSGWWEYDEAIVANHVILPKSRVQTIFDKAGIGNGIGTDGITGSWNMDVMLGSSLHIEQDMNQILSNCGFQASDKSGDNYILTGINWGYTGFQITNNLDLTTIIMMIAILFIIFITGYLIIYNVFQVSVSNDIRYFGLLKTIGTTGKQLQSIIRRQVLLLSATGIPIGLLFGYGIGVKLTPVILSQLNGVTLNTVSVSPIIFIGSGLFSLITVMISCHRPGRMAARVSPIEAIRYTEGASNKKKGCKAQSGASLQRMAWANMGRNSGKTVITVLSLSLAILLLNMTFTFAKGFDVDKYLSNVVSDFIVADASYFQTENNWSKEFALPEDVIISLEANAGIIAGGRVYGKTGLVEEYVTEEYYRSKNSMWYDSETLDHNISLMDRDKEGLLADWVQLYGMERYTLDKLTVVQGDLTKLYEPGSRCIAAVYSADEGGNANSASHWSKVGDKVKLQYGEEYQYYEVAAQVILPRALSYRYYGADEFIMNDKTFMQDSGTNDILYYACDVEKEHTTNIEEFLYNLTNVQLTQLDYESKLTYIEKFNSLQNMFLILGGVLSFIIGLIGVLNFINAIVISFFIRRREFAMLQSIGMTGKQLKKMLIWEGLYYALGAIAASFLLTITIGLLLSNVLEMMFWFFTYQVTFLPIIMISPVFILLGIVIPLVTYYIIAKRSVIERLREAE